MATREYIGMGIGLIFGAGTGVLSAKWAGLDLGPAIVVGFGFLVAGAYWGKTLAEK